MEVNTNIEIDRNLAVGMFVIGAMSHYTAEEISMHKDINYIMDIMRKKHFGIKNGTTETRMWSKPMFVRNEIKKNPRKAEQFVKKGDKAIIDSLQASNNWTIHSEIANKAWTEASNLFNKKNAISVNQLVSAILRKSPKTFSWYKFNQKKVDKFTKSGECANTHIFSSSKVASKLLEILDFEIAHYNYNRKAS